MALKNWRDKWKVIGKCGRGGQGLTLKVQDESGRICALKKLKNQKNEKARQRMRREATSLETMNLPGLPEFIESNTEFFTDSSVDLYLVSEFIDGRTLDKVVEDGRFTIVEAVGVVTRLLQTVEACHLADIFHRDIKPENVLLRKDQKNNPVLIDFGTSFNRVDPDETGPTEVGDQFRNRFLVLPELLEKGVEKRDGRCDITFCIGLLLYMITGIEPDVLTNKNGELPHQRTASKKILDGISLPNPSTKDALISLFDHCFVPEIDRRLTKFSEIYARLTYILRAPLVEGELPLEEVMRQLKQTQGSAAYAEQKRRAAVWDRFYNPLWNGIRFALNEIHEKGWTFHNLSGGGEDFKAAWNWDLGIENENNPLIPKLTVMYRFMEFGAYLVINMEITLGPLAIPIFKKDVLRIPIVDVHENNKMNSINNPLLSEIREQVLRACHKAKSGLPSI